MSVLIKRFLKNTQSSCQVHFLPMLCQVNALFHSKNMSVVRAFGKTLAVQTAINSVLFFTRMYVSVGPR